MVDKHTVSGRTIRAEYICGYARVMLPLGFVFPEISFLGCELTPNWGKPGPNCRVMHIHVDGPDQEMAMRRLRVEIGKAVAILREILGE